MGLIYNLLIKYIKTFSVTKFSFFLKFPILNCNKFCTNTIISQNIDNVDDILCNHFKNKQ